MTDSELLRLKIEELKQRQAMAWRRIADPQITPSERREVRKLLKESGSALFNDNVQVKFNSGGMSLMLGNEEARDGRLQWRQDLSTQHAGPAAMARALLDPRPRERACASGISRHSCARPISQVMRTDRGHRWLLPLVLP